MTLAKITAALSVLALAGCSSPPESASKPIWEVMKDEDQARARVLGPNSFRPQDDPFPHSQPVWRGSRPN